MREGSTSRARWLLCSRLAAGLLAFGSLAACGGTQVQPGTAAATDDQALAADIAQGKSGAEVTFDAIVASEPADGGGHERFTVAARDGRVIEIDHNNSLAPEVPAHVGDQVVIRGQLYIDPGPRIGVHCTHAHTSRGCPIAGFIQLRGATYQ